MGVKNKRLITIFVVLCGAAVLLYFLGFFPVLKEFCSRMTEQYGLAGLFVVGLVLDLFIHPVSSGIFVSLAVLGGLNVWEASLATTLGSMIGGSLYYILGRKGAATEQYDAVKQRMHGFVKRNNLLLLFSFNATTGPFTMLSLLAGHFKVPYGKFLLIALPSRYIKILMLAVLGFGARQVV